jgi:hypothetical protein
MAHFAQLDGDNIVTTVIVVADADTADEDGNEIDSIGEAFCADLLGGTWKRTSYNHNYRTRFAGIGMVYDEGRDAFRQPQPFPSFILDEDTLEWHPPVTDPNLTSPVLHHWDEDTTSWVEVT